MVHKNIKLFKAFQIWNNNVKSRWVLPAAASQTEMNIALIWHSLEIKIYYPFLKGARKDKFYLIEVDNFRTLRYWRMSGIDIKRSTLKNLRPATLREVFKRNLVIFQLLPIQVLSRKMLTNIGGIVK